MNKTIAVLDGNSLMHRAYHAIPPTMSDGEGRPTNAVFGFLAMLLKFYEDVTPDAIICAFDAGKPAFRMEALAEYKAQRPPMDDELRCQFPIIEELLSAMDIPVVKVEGWEGDDILGTIAARDEAKGFQTLLVTGDKDACQLASPLTKIVSTRKGITDVAVMGPEEVEERYGVTPAQFCDYLGLMGDSSDNIPGVAGIGPKTASKLLQQFGSIEGVYEGIDALKGKQKENLEAGRDMAFLSRTIATIVRDLDFSLDIDDARFPAFEIDRVVETFQKYRLSSHLQRLLNIVNKPYTPVSDISLSYEPIHREAEGLTWVQSQMSQKACFGIALTQTPQTSLFDDGLSVALAAAGQSALLNGDDAREALAAVVTEGSFVTLDCKALLQTIYPPDTAQPALIDEAQLLRFDGFDLGLAAYALNSSESSYSIAQLAETYLGSPLPSESDSEASVLIEAAASLLLKEALAQALETQELEATYGQIDLPLVAVLVLMERVGVALDDQRLEEVNQQASASIAELSGQIYELAGKPFNIDSPKQLAQLLFEDLGLPPLKKNRRGYSTDASVLTELAKNYELPGLVLRYRELSKIKSTYIDALPALRSPGDGRIHTTFHETVTTTGRLSSSNPNLQNIPVRTDFGRQIRECFVPLHPGEVFLAADYSQIELRVLAHLSGDEHLIEAFQSGADFHQQTAARVFDVPLESVTPALRSRAKAVNFGIVYGQQAFGLSQSLDIPFKEAKEMIDRYFEAYPGVRTYLDKTIADATERGWAETMFGRKRHIPELKASQAQRRGFGERTAMNHPMQGSAADLIKVAMRRVIESLKAQNLHASLMLQVHDELDFSVPEEEVEIVAKLVAEIMESVVEMKVPLVVDVAWGQNWAQAH